MSDFSRKYQTQITGREGEAFVQNGVKFDGMSDGVLIEAKGSYSQFVDPSTGKFERWFTGSETLINQANRQIEASEGARIQWYFSDQQSLSAFQTLFREKGVYGIEFIYQPMK